MTKSAQEEDDKNWNSIFSLKQISGLGIQWAIQKLHTWCRATYTSIHTSNVMQTTSCIGKGWIIQVSSSLRCHWACRHLDSLLLHFFFPFFLSCNSLFLQIAWRISRQLTTSEAGDRAHDFHAMVEQRCGPHAHQEEAQGDGQSSPSPNNPGSRHLHLQWSYIHTISPRSSSSPPKP